MKALLYWILLILSDASAQLLLKKGALIGLAQHHYFNLFIVGGYLTIFFSFIIWMYILKETPLYVALSTSSVAYIVIAIASYYIFDEALTTHIFLGTILISAGVYIINYSYLKKNKRE